MCNPALIAGAVGLTGGLQFAAQQQQFKMQRAEQARAAALQRQQLLKQYTAEQLQLVQQKEAAGRQAILQDLEQAKTAATEVTAMGQSGGVSEAPLQDLYTQYGRVREAHTRQQELIDVGTGMRFEELGFRHQQEMARIQKPLIRPNFLIAGLETGTKAAMAYKTFSA